MFAQSITKFGRRFQREESGTIIIMAAALVPAILAATALAVDVGALYVERRQAQGAADLAAIAGAADLNRAEDAVAATLKVNGITDATSLKVTRGFYEADAKLPPAQRFRPGVLPYNAVQVDLVKPGRIYFANVFRSGPVPLGVTAVAANASLATFSVGSRLLAVRDGILNQLAGALLGANVNLSVMDYNALIAADVKINGFLDALASELKLTGATYNDVLNANMKAANVLNAAAAVTGKDGNGGAASALLKLSSQAGGATLAAPLTTLLNLGPMGTASIGQGSPGLDAGINLMDLVTGTAVLSDGKHQVAVDLGATVPGLLSLKVDLTIGERPQHSPWVAVGQPGASVYTTQTRLRIVAEIGGSGLLAGVRIRLPIGVDLAYAKATLAAVTCSGGDSSSARATIATKPGIAKAWIGEVSTSALGDFSKAPVIAPARIVDTHLIKVTGRADVAATNTSDIMLEFTQADVDNKVIKRAETKNIAETVVTSLLKNLALRVQIGGLGIGLPGALQALVAQALGNVAKPLDEVVHTLLNTLGVHLGEADVRVHGIRCGAAVLTG
jgi:uncharacterized membrane protein